MTAATTPQQSIEREKLSHALAMFAKLLCSGSFVVGRDPDEFFEHDIKTHLRPEGNPFDWDEVEVDVHEARQEVTLSARGISRTARCHGGQGCTIIPEGSDEVHFMPAPVVPHVPDPETTLWPMGDRLPDEPLPPEVDAKALEAAFDFAVDDDALPKPQKTRAVVVLYKDRLVGERYAPGFTKDTRHVSWSSGKSITSALIGLLVKDGHFTVEDPAPVAEWRSADDPRREIRIADLLHMSSGLQFVRAQDDDRLAWGWTSRDDHMYIYFGAINVFEHSISRPLEFPPGTVWRYRNGDTLTLGALVRRTVEARGEDYLTFPQRALFDKLGMRNMVLETDPWGNFIMTGYDYGTARDWARFGLLHLRHGVWPPSGERILPEGWVDFISTPAPAAEERQYGGQFWLNAGGRHPDIPRDAFWAAGAWGQVTMAIPSRDMVIVRLGHAQYADDSFGAYINAVYGRILGAVRSE
jgi:CubicO group peptidase (beta-lactamase class C family)